MTSQIQGFIESPPSDVNLDGWCRSIMTAPRGPEGSVMPTRHSSNTATMMSQLISFTTCFMRWRILQSSHEALLAGQFLPISSIIATLISLPHLRRESTNPQIPPSGQTSEDCNWILTNAPQGFANWSQGVW